MSSAGRRWTVSAGLIARPFLLIVLSALTDRRFADRVMAPASAVRLVLEETDDTSGWQAPGDSSPAVWRNSRQCTASGVHRKARARRSCFTGRKGRECCICVRHTGLRWQRETRSRRFPSSDEAGHGEYHCCAQGFRLRLGSSGEDECLADAVRRLRRDEPYLLHVFSRRQVSGPYHRCCRRTTSPDFLLEIECEALVK